MSTDVAVRWARTPLSPDRRARSLELLTAAERTREPTDGFLAGRLLLRELAGEERPLTATCPDCGREHGQVRLEGLFASIAHAGDLVVVAVADAPVGIDVERTDAEVPAIFADGAAGWTALEAVLKADGRGLRLDPSDVEFTPPLRSFRTKWRGAAAPDVRNDHGRAEVGGSRYDVSYVETAPGFTCAVARAVTSSSATSRTARRAGSR